MCGALVIGAILAGQAVKTMAGPSLLLAAVQSIGSAGLLWAALPTSWRMLAPVAGAVLLAGLGLGAQVSAAAGLRAVAGLSHAMLYGGLLAVFATSLWPGRVALVTRLAQRINPKFRLGMVPYTRGVTWAWAGFAAAQLAASAVLLAGGWIGAWVVLVGPLHPLLALALAAGEFAVRSQRFPGEHTGFIETVRGVRRR